MSTLLKFMSSAVTGFFFAHMLAKVGEVVVDECGVLRALKLGFEYM